MKNNIIKQKIKKEIDISKKERFSKKRFFIIFSVVLVLLLFLIVLWGGLVYKNTGWKPSSSEIVKY